MVEMNFFFAKGGFFYVTNSDRLRILDVLSFEATMFYRSVEIHFFVTYVESLPNTNMEP